MSRRQARETALQVLFQIDLLKDEENNPEHIVERWADEFALPNGYLPFAKELVIGTIKNRQRIDHDIELISKDWTLKRMSGVDRNLLRLACFELLYREDIPASVTINEAIEIAKHYGSEDSARFVNGILDQMAAKCRALSDEDKDKAQAQEQGKGKDIENDAKGEA